VTFEHGHANHLSDDWSSTAYWYQKLPTAPLTLPPVADRLPLRPRDAVVSAQLPPLSAAQAAAREATEERMRHFTELRDRVQRERAAEVDTWEAGNVAQARRVRARFLSVGARR
jgi:hypothetical protein